MAFVDDTVEATRRLGTSKALERKVVQQLCSLLWAHNESYAPVSPTTGIVYDGAGNVTSVTENGVTTTYTYGPNGVASDTRLGVTRTHTYDGSGNLNEIAS